MRIRFWGTRGSIPRPGPETVRYGGNTSCVEVRSDDGTRILLDVGTGAHELGIALRDEAAAERLGGHLLIGHTHWDHIQGFPFFAPFFERGGQWDVYAPGGRTQHIEDTLAGQMSYDYHPVTVDSFDAAVRFHDLREGRFECGRVRVSTRYLNHPALTLGYRLEADGAVLVYATDHEPHSILPLDAAPGAEPVHYEDRRHLEFLAGADVVIHDAQFTLGDFPAKLGWGHTPVERAVDYAIAARVGQLVLFHHDPLRTDAEVDALLELARERAARGDFVPDVRAAAEGETLELPRREAAPRREPAAVERVPSALLPKEPPRASTVLLVEDDPDMTAVLRGALEPEGVRLIHAGDGESALAVARRDRPSLVLLDLKIPMLDGLEVCRRIRGEGDARLRRVPILILTGNRPDERGMLEAFRAGATDFLTKPVKPTLVRSRVRGWLLRRLPEA